MKSIFALLFAASISGKDLPVENTLLATPVIVNIETPVSNLETAGVLESNVISNLAPTSQKDPEATAILNAVTNTTKTRKTITLDFTFTIKNGDMKESQKGKLQIKGNSYSYDIFGTTKISDGKKVAEIIVEDKEVTIGSANFNDPDNFSPQEMFTIYEKGYKYRFMGQKNINGETLELIDLYPDADNKQPYRRITLFVNNTTHEIKEIELFEKTSAKVFSVKIDNATYDLEIPDAEFNCDCERWPAPNWDCDDTSESK